MLDYCHFQITIISFCNLLCANKVISNFNLKRLFCYLISSDDPKQTLETPAIFASALQIIPFWNEKVYTIENCQMLRPFSKVLSRIGNSSAHNRLIEDRSFESNLTSGRLALAYVTTAQFVLWSPNTSEFRLENLKEWFPTKHCSINQPIQH